MPPTRTAPASSSRCPPPAEHRPAPNLVVDVAGIRERRHPDRGVEMTTPSSGIVSSSAAARCSDGRVPATTSSSCAGGDPAERDDQHDADDRQHARQAGDGSQLVVGGRRDHLDPRGCRSARVAGTSARRSRGPSPARRRGCRTRRCRRWRRRAAGWARMPRTAATRPSTAASGTSQRERRADRVEDRTPPRPATSPRATRRRAWSRTMLTICGPVICTGPPAPTTAGVGVGDDVGEELGGLRVAGDRG